MHERNMHIEIDIHFIREQVLRKQLVIEYCPTNINLITF